MQRQFVLKNNLRNGEKRKQLHTITEINIEGKKYYCCPVKDLMRIKVGLKTEHFMSIDKEILNEEPEYFSSFAELSQEELKLIDDKIGYTYNRNVYG